MPEIDLVHRFGAFLEEQGRVAAGHEIPVFLSDGEIQVGVYMASGSGGGIPS